MKKAISVFIILMIVLTSSAQAFAAENTLVNNTAEAISFVKEKMLNREESFCFDYPVSVSELGSFTMNALLDPVMDGVFKHTGKGNEGDFLKNDFMSYSASGGSGSYSSADI